VTVDEYFNWFRACGYEATGEGTATTVELYNPNRNKFISVPRPENMTPEQRRQEAQNIGHHFGWTVAQGVH
jgi:hypothetical protein